MTSFNCRVKTRAANSVAVYFVVVLLAFVFYIAYRNFSPSIPDRASMPFTALRVRGYGSFANSIIVSDAVHEVLDGDSISYFAQMTAAVFEESEFSSSSASITVSVISHRPFESSGSVFCVIGFLWLAPMVLIPQADDLLQYSTAVSVIPPEPPPSSETGVKLKQLRFESSSRHTKLAALRRFKGIVRDTEKNRSWISSQNALGILIPVVLPIIVSGVGTFLSLLLSCVHLYFV